MGGWGRQKGDDYDHKVTRTRSQSRKPPIVSGNWQPTVPWWEKEFCKVVGSISWKKLLECKKYMYLYENVLNWNDSAGEEAFHNAKNRFYAQINRVPCNIALPDPDIYLDKIDWNSEVDHELYRELEQDPLVPNGVEKDGNVVILGEHLLPKETFFCTGWGEAEDFKKVEEYPWEISGARESGKEDANQNSRKGGEFGDNSLDKNNVGKNSWDENNGGKNSWDENNSVGKNSWDENNNVCENSWEENKGREVVTENNVCENSWDVNNNVCENSWEENKGREVATESNVCKNSWDVNNNVCENSWELNNGREVVAESGKVDNWNDYSCGLNNWENNNYGYEVLNKTGAAASYGRNEGGVKYMSRYRTSRFHRKDQYAMNREWGNENGWKRVNFSHQRP